MQTNIRIRMMIITALTAVFLCLQNSAKAELWDVSYSQPLTEQQICDTVEQKPLAGAQLQSNVEAQLASVEDLDDTRIVIEGGVYYTNGWCWIRANQNAKRGTRSRKPDGTWTAWNDQQWNFASTMNGVISTAPNCDPESNYSLQNGDRCWDPQDLNERDSCPEDGFLPNLPNPVGSTGQYCRELEDGSKCGYRASADGSNLEYDSSMDCYAVNYAQYEEPTNQEPPEGQCQNITTGNVPSTFCPADPDAVCPNGVCTPSCGSFDIGYGEVFGCFSDENDNVCDQDNDGMIDEACSTPPPSCDVDPNQPHCPTSPDPVNCEEQPDHEYCQTPPPSCETDPTVEGCGTEPPEEPPVSPPELIEGLKGIKEEQQRTTEATEGVKTAVETLGTKLDELETEQKKTTDAVENTAAGIGVINGHLGNAAGVRFGSGPSQGLTGWYESEYPEGFKTLMEEVTPIYYESQIYAYLKSWELSVAGDFSFPQICVDVGIANLGCHDFSIDARVFPFIRIILIVSALLLARRLVFGG